MPTKKEIEINLKNQEKMKEMLGDPEVGFTQMSEEQIDENEFCVSFDDKLRMMQNDVIELSEENKELTRRIDELVKRIGVLEQGGGVVKEETPLKFPGSSGGFVREQRQVKFPRKSGPGNYYTPV